MSTAIFEYDSESGLGGIGAPGGTGLPLVMSLSDDHMPQYGLVSILIASGTTTTQSIIINLGVSYYRGYSGD